ncbi:zinc ribbon domain-containing protein [Nocardioides sp. KC13]|uniref:Zinc ribbon domain-containing protein n=1 Tax=Nocardioides turkmenicus TaxID=2711220 RepID=A0A6M1QZP8_9ACTN|nr:zinc ribbon domain-containing protein [Nocardioides sp. KC13]NGN95473.1 zinc ribbon domain-containing protein [Nocardioides sp. KC13]
MNDEKDSCPSCGDPLLPGAIYCIGCGTPLLAPPEHHRPLFVDEIDDEAALHRSTRGFFFEDAPPPPTPRKGRTGPILVTIAVLVLIAGVLGFVFGKDSPVRSEADPSTSPTATGPSGDPTVPPSVDPDAPPEHQLLRISRLDTEAASKLIGTWIPQLAAVGAGDGGDTDWHEALSRYQQIKTDHPDVLLLDTGEWPSSYVKSGMYAVVVPYPSDTSGPALEWCVEQGLSKTDCAAKHLEVSGDPTDNYDAQ